MSRVSFWLARLYKHGLRLTRWKQLILAYPLLLVFSGVLSSPLFACLVAGVYELGLCGFVLLFDSRFRVERVNQFLYGGLGALLVVVCWLWLEILYII